jgi:hypothetical protein
MVPAMFWSYSRSMKINNKKYFLKTRNGFVLNTVVVAALAGGLSYADGQGIRISVPSPVVVVSPPAVVVAAPVVVAQDNYVYYPSYGVYYNTERHQYAYQDGGAWVSRPAPIGVSADVLLASPSVKMDFHDSPANHHADMARKYPKNYQAGHSEQGRDSRDDHRQK